MSVLRKSNKKVSSRQQIDIRSIKDGVLILPNHRYRAVLHVSPVNFELRSEDEQDAIIETYESFLNSVGVPLQVLIRIREMDMDAYLDDLDNRLQNETVAIYKTQLANYEEFIRELIKTNRILSRQFYVIVPYNSDGKADFDLIQEQLGLTVDIVQKGLARLGMHSRELSSLELMDLFYNFYNPTKAKLQPLTDKALELIHTSYVQKEPAA
ncbi:MAG TPA: TraC family protein [Candidatus Saccharimonadales bacterium]|nr:TraC family protein [Candidatus Saccharimonadales bacterium]